MGAMSSCVFTCVCVCVCVCVSVCIHIYIYTFSLSLNVYIYLYIYMCLYVYTLLLELIWQKVTIKCSLSLSLSCYTYFPLLLSGREGGGYTKPSSRIHIAPYRISAPLSPYTAKRFRNEGFKHCITWPGLCR